jgi:hypothetical protein
MTSHDTDTFEQSDEDASGGEDDGPPSMEADFDTDDETGAPDLDDLETSTDPIAELGLTETEIPPDGDPEQSSDDGTPETSQSGDDGRRDDGDSRAELQLDDPTDTSTGAETGAEGEAETPATAAETPEEGGVEVDASPERRDPDGDGSVVTALVEELEERDLSEEEASVLAESLGLETENSVDVRVRHLQNQVADLVAYRDALEEFIDDNGAATELIADLQDQNEDLADRLDRLEAQLDDVQTTVERLGERQRADVSDLRERTDAVEMTVDERTDTIEAELADVRRRVEDGEQWREQLNGALKPLAEGLAGDGATGDESSD